MNEKRRKKGESENKYTEVLLKNPKGLTKIEIRNKTNLSPSTEADITQRLQKKGAIKPIDVWSEKRKKLITKYVLVDLENLADPDELHLLTKMYRSALSENNSDKIKVILEDIRNICECKKVRDKEFILFLIEQIQKNNNDISRKTEFIRSLGNVSISLLKTIETEEHSPGEIFGSNEKGLLRIVNESIDSIKDIIYSDKLKISERAEIFKMLTQFHFWKKFEIAFELLKKLDHTTDLNKPKNTVITDTMSDEESYEILKYHKMKRYGGRNKITELDIFLPTIQEMIISYAKINRIDCRKKLYDLITTDNEIKNIAITLLEQIRYNDITSEYSFSHNVS